MLEDLLFFGEAIFKGEEAEEFSSGAVLEDEVQFFFILKAMFEVY